MKILFSYLLFSLWLFYVPVSASSELDQIINGLQGKYLRLNTLTAEFIQIYNAPGERSRREGGQLPTGDPVCDGE